MSRRPAWLLLCTPILLLSLQAKAADTSNVLTTDQRLVKPIRVTLKDVPVSVLLPQFTKATGVPLLWDKEIADLRASIFLRNQPASRVLLWLATCLRLMWRPEADGYRLYRPTAITRNDEQQREQWEDSRAKRLEEERQLNEFTTALLRQSHLTDEEVKKLVAKFPYIAKTMKEEPWFLVGLRAVTWLTPEEWDKASVNNLRLDYQAWTQTGPDPDLPVPTVDSGTVKLIEATIRQQGKEPGEIAIERAPGQSGIKNIGVGIQRDGRLTIEVDYVVTGGFGYSRAFVFGAVRNRR